MTFTHALSINNYGSAKFIVSANTFEGTHTTIAAALTSASSGDTIFNRPGTYTENLTLKAGVSLSAYISDAFTPNVTISGTCTLTTAGTVSMSGIRLQTNSAALLAVTGSAASIVNLINCYLNMTNNTGITFSSSSASAQIVMRNCAGNLGTTGIGIFSHSSSGNLSIVNTIINNSGSSLTASTCSAGTLTLLNSYLPNPVTMSSTGVITSKYTEIDCSATNVTCLTTVTGSNIVQFTRLSSGTATPLSVAGTVVSDAIILNHSNATAVTGAGTLVYNSIFQDATIGAISVTTLTGKGNVGMLNSTVPAVGYIGELLSASNTTGTAIPTGTTTNITSLTLTPGIWDITGNFSNIPTGTMTLITDNIAAISTANNNTTPVDNFGSGIGLGIGYFPNLTPTSGHNLFFNLGPCRVSIAANTTYYLNAICTGTTVNTSGYGVLRAVRVA